MQRRRLSRRWGVKTKLPDLKILVELPSSHIKGSVRGQQPPMKQEDWICYGLPS